MSPLNWYTVKMNNPTYTWYATLTKPSWAPPAWVFGPVWTVLYLIIAISFGYVLIQVAKRRYPPSVAAPFISNLIFNAAFTPLQFGLRNNELALIDIVLVWATMIWAGVIIWRKARWVVYANLPYFIWVSFATILQLAITILNAH